MKTKRSTKALALSLLIGAGLGLIGCADEYAAYPGYGRGYYGYTGYHPSYYGYGAPYANYSPYYGAPYYYGGPYYGTRSVVVTRDRTYVHNNAYRYRYRQNRTNAVRHSN